MNEDLANEPWGDETPPAPITHDPCCWQHNAALDCDTYRRTHVVESEPCCATWAETNPYGGWVPHGCPAGFSSLCSQWSDTICKCLILTLPHKNWPRKM